MRRVPLPCPSGRRVSRGVSAAKTTNAPGQDRLGAFDGWVRVGQPSDASAASSSSWA